MTKTIAAFIIMFVIGLIGSVYAYAQPDAGNWCIVFVFMFIVGLLGFVVALIWYLIKRRKT